MEIRAEDTTLPEFEFIQLAPNSSERTCDLKVVDYNSDGKMDFVTANIFGYDVFYKGNGDGTFVQETLLGDGSCRGLDFGDYDGDLDIAVASTDGRLSYIYRNDGGTYVAVQSWGAGFPWQESRSVEWGDYNGDGKLDLFSGCYGWNKYTGKIVNTTSILFINNGNDTFSRINYPNLQIKCIKAVD